MLKEKKIYQIKKRWGVGSFFFRRVRRPSGGSGVLPSACRQSAQPIGHIVHQRPASSKKKFNKILFFLYLLWKNEEEVEEEILCVKHPPVRVTPRQFVASRFFLSAPRSWPFIGFFFSLQHFKSISIKRRVKDLHQDARMAVSRFRFNPPNDSPPPSILMQMSCAAGQPDRIPLPGHVKAKLDEGCNISGMKRDCPYGKVAWNFSIMASTWMQATTWTTKESTFHTQHKSTQQWFKGSRIPPGPSAGPFIL